MRSLWPKALTSQQHNGTLAREAAEQHHEVFMTSATKDMMQLDLHAGILNPQKDNLILDPAKVIETLSLRTKFIDGGGAPSSITFPRP